MRVVISGYYGFGNLGDEAVLAAMLAALRPRLPHASFVVVSADPAATTRGHRVDAVSRLGPAAMRAFARLSSNARPWRRASSFTL